jgi:hypothetical protein
MRLVGVEWLQGACPATLALSTVGEATMLDLDFDPGVPVLEVIESLVRKVLGNRDDLFDTLFGQVVKSRSAVEHVAQRWGDLSEITRTKIACDIGYKAWVLLESGIGDDDLSALSFG